MVVAPSCRCRLCCRDEMEIRKTAHAGRLFFCPSAVGGGAYIFASSESHRNAHRTPPPLRPYHYTTEPKNATQRATESDRANDQSTTTEPPTRDRQHHAGRQRDRERPPPTEPGAVKIWVCICQNFARQNFKICGQNLVGQILVCDTFEIAFFELSIRLLLTERIVRSEYDFLLVGIPKVVLHKEDAGHGVYLARLHIFLN